MVRVGVLVWAHHILTVETDLASQAKSLQFYQELKSQMISTQGVQTNDLPYLPKYKMSSTPHLFFNSFSEKWGVPLESRTQLKTSCMDIFMKFRSFEGRVFSFAGSSYTWVNTAQLKTVKMMACPTDSVHVDTAYPVFQRPWNVIFSPRDVTFLILQEAYFRGTKIVTQINLK